MAQVNPLLRVSQARIMLPAVLPSFPELEIFFQVQMVAGRMLICVVGLFSYWLFWVYLSPSAMCSALP
jgi:hypothetical protein